MKLIVSTFEQEISSASLGNNSIQITNENIKNAFNNSPPGTIFNPSISVTYDDPAFPSGNGVNFSSSLSYVPRQITPYFTFANIPDKTTSDSPFSVSGLITKDGTGAVSYTSSNQAVATIDPSTGLVTIVGKGTTTITATLAASADRVYTAVPPIQKTLDVTSNEILDIKRNGSTYRLYYTLTSGLSASYVNSISLESNSGSGGTTPHPDRYGTISPNSYYLEFSIIFEPTFNAYFNFISLKNGDTELVRRENIYINGGF
jgi:hypothetical protein